MPSWQYAFCVELCWLLKEKRALFFLFLICKHEAEEAYGLNAASSQACRRLYYNLFLILVSKIFEQFHASLIKLGIRDLL